MPLVGPGSCLRPSSCVGAVDLRRGRCTLGIRGPANEGENIQNAMGSLGHCWPLGFRHVRHGVWLAVIGHHAADSIHRGHEPTTFGSGRRRGHEHLGPGRTLGCIRQWVRGVAGRKRRRCGRVDCGRTGPRFGWLGTPIICGTGLAIGLWCAADRMLSPILARLPFAKLVQYCRESITVVINLVQPEPATGGGSSQWTQVKKAKPAATVAVLEPRTRRRRVGRRRGRG